MNLRVLQETEEFLGLFWPCCLLSSALVIIIIIIIGVILSSLSLSPVKLILCNSRGQTLHALPFHTPILRAINIVSNAHSTKLVSYFFFFTLFYFLVLLLLLSWFLQGLITQKTINTWGEKATRVACLLAPISLGMQPLNERHGKLRSYTHAAVKLAQLFRRNNFS
jgi:hypothetical protein